MIGWVGRHVLPHEAQLRAWLRRSFAAIDVDDVVQEAYCRIASLRAFDHIEDPRRYLFQTARNVVLEDIRRTRVVSIDAASGLAVLESAATDVASPERTIAGRRALARVEQLIAALPDRARRIFRMRKIQGLPQREIALRLGISETIVENEVARGLRRILQSMSEEERAEMPIRRTRSTPAGQRSRRHD